jgi:hypothetical protein
LLLAGHRLGAAAALKWMQWKQDQAAGGRMHPCLWLRTPCRAQRW